MKRAHGRALLVSLLLFGLLAGTADAAKLTVACAGKGPRNRDSSGTVLCAGGLKGRTIAGTIRNDAGQPVAGKVTVTFKAWKPARNGIGYNVTPTGTRDITAKPNGTFAIAVNPATKQGLQFDLAADPALGIASGVSAEAEVSRQLTFRVAKLGGGMVRVTVIGTSLRPVKVSILDSAGYRIGVAPKNIDRAGRAAFNLGSRRGNFTIFADAGKYGDLFWFGARPKFHL